MTNIIIFDWLSCTASADLDSFDIVGNFNDGSAFCNLLGINLDNFCCLNGVRGFSKRLYFSGISIHLPSDTMPYCWLEMSGQGCRAFESYGYGDWKNLLSFCLSHFNIKRLDVAYDDHESILPLDRLLNDTLNKNYISKARKHSIEISLDDTLSYNAISIYHGSQSSNVLIRIYDKAAQLGLDSHWVRSELQLKDNNAKQFISKFVYGLDLGYLYRGVLLNYIRYIIPSKDSNKSRHELTDYWNNFIADCSSIRIYSNPGIVYNLSNLTDFVFNQAGNAISTYIRCFGFDEFKRYLNAYGRKLPKKYEYFIETNKLQGCN